MTEEVLTAEQVAKLLKVHTYTVLKYIKEGKLKAFKLGRVYRIGRENVDSFLKSLMEKPPAPPKQTRKDGKPPEESGHYYVIE